MVKYILVMIITAGTVICFADEPVEPEIVTLDAMTIVGMQSLVSMKHNVIHELWIRFMESGFEIENKAYEGVHVSISWGYKDVGDDGKKETQFFHLVGAPVTHRGDIPPGFTYKEIAIQKYAKFVHKGSLTTLGQTYDEIFTQWLPASDYLYDVGKCDVEWYDERFRYGEEDSELDIYVPVMNKEE